jgi:uncharacterized repeat protein (TIGR03803 family)
MSNNDNKEKITRKLRAILSADVKGYTIATGTYEVLHPFGGVAGNHPDGSIYLASDGVVYGTTTEGGANGYGALFSCWLDTGMCDAVYDFTEDSGFGSYFTQISEVP